MDSVRATFARNGLYRSSDRRVFAGVVAGLGRRFGIDPWPARLLFVVALLVIPGCQLIVYPTLWICMPVEGAGTPVPA